MSWLVGLVAAISTGLCLLFWFRDVGRIMRKRASMVKSAEGQLKVSRRDAAQSPGDPRRQAVLSRSQDIYLQAVELYNQEMRKLWIFLPARLMGFRRIEKDCVIRSVGQ